MRIYRKLEDIQNTEFEIPDIDENLVFSLFEKIKPVKRNINGKFDLIKDCDPIKTAFTFNMEINKPLEKELDLIDTCYVNHSCYYGLYKGSMEEVFAGILYHERFNEVDYIEATFASIHPSGSGVISQIDLYKVKG
jgi:hypothetical protein